MNINTLQISSSTKRDAVPIRCARATLLAGALLGAGSFAQAGTVLGPWVPLFRGIDHAIGTNTAAGGGFPNLQVVHFLRVDLADPTIELFASPRNPTNYVVNYIETAGYTATNFLKNHNLQVAINANSFARPGSSSSPSYTVPEGSAFHAGGVLFSQGMEVSPQESAVDSAALLFTTNNTATFVPTNWPASSTAGIYTAVSGLYAVLVNGVNIGSNYNVNVDPHGVEPRTAFGLSQDRRYLFLLTIDGRQPGYSAGAYDWETAAWLLLAGASDGVNMDGGGSTCMVMRDSTGAAIPLNRDNASPAVGRERTVGVHFGVYAQPVPGFFTNVLARPDDTAATITWQTIEPATTQIKYGLTTNLPLATAVDPALVTDHAVLLTNLTAGTNYYFAAYASVATNEYVSSTFVFATTNYVTRHTLVDFTNTWKYTIANLDGTNWPALTYDDSAWEGAGPGLLWVDINGANPEIPLPPLTQLPADPGTDYPYTTYYFRTHFDFTNSLSGVTLMFEGYVDDGAVFYLNGTEISRLRLPDAPTPIANATLATNYPCSGNATCPDSFALSGPLIATNLLTGDNVLAVEVHNWNPGSSDVTFGLSLAYTRPYVLSPTLNLVYSNGLGILSWTQGGFTLQQADTVTGDWVNVPGPVVSSPYSTPVTNSTQLFRLIK